MARGIKEGYLRQDLEPEFVYQLLQAFVIYFIPNEFDEKERREKLILAFECLIEGIKNSDL